ncbi:hypothetical protein [Photobacterium phage PDCC-1]|uniref:Uncharacterized protein n=1 Tax=Photobacterium phage PDCC-1 TaxID=2664246 RepID=A0A6B9J1T0_9CAUD|nr:internal head protein [Photobacterium phage PDCC-1]QGZ14409.1 hypothetical protein [Photobacterium phage PDCC-1]
MSLRIKEMLALQAGMETLGTPTPVEMTAEEAHELANEIAHKQMEAEINENSKEINEIAEVVEDVQDEVEELEEVVEGLEALAKLPELNRPTINVLYRRAQRLNAGLGGNEPEQVAGNESLSDDAYRAAVVTGCEGFMETMKKAYESTSSFIKNIFYALVDAVKKLFSFATDQSEKAKKLKAEVDGKELRTPIKLGGWNRWFNGKVDSMDKVIADVSGVIPEFGNLLKEMTDVTSVSAEDNDKLLGKVTSLADKFEAAIKKSGSPWTAGKGRTTNGTNFVQWIVPNKDDFKGETVDKAIAAFQFNVEAGSHMNTLEGTKLSGEAPAMFSKSDVGGILDTVTKNAETIKKMKADVDGLKSTVDEVINKLKKGPKGDDDKAAKVRIAALKRFIGKYSQLVNNYCRIVSNIDNGKLAAVKAHF